MRPLVGQRAIAALILLACAAYSFSFMPYLSDDALISLRYSQRLLEGKGLTWTEGIPVEGYSNLAWVLLTAMLGWLGMDLILAARLLGVVCTLIAASGIGTVAAAAAVMPADAMRSTPRGRLAAVLLYGLSGTTAVWAIGGLEQPLVAACLAWAMVGILRLAASPAPAASQAIMPGLAWALMCLTRPDSPLFVGTACLSLLWIWHRRGQGIAWRTLLVLAGLPLACLVAQTLFRHAYYDAWVPNTALVKARPSLRHMLHGGLYVAKGLMSLLPLLAMALLSARALWKSEHRAAACLLIPPICLWLAYVVLIGGDVFPAFRHFTPVVVLLAMLTSAGAGLWLSRLSAPQAWACILGAAVGLLGCQQITPDVDGAREERWEWAGQDLATMLRQGFAPAQPLIAVSAAGSLPYWTGWPAIDMLGLNDHYLPRHPPPDFGSGHLGHELGSGPYVFSRRPDMVIYHIGLRDDPFLTGRQLAQMPAFLALYAPVRLYVRASQRSDFDAYIWMNRESPLIGMRRAGASLHIPGYLVGGDRRLRVTLAEDGRLRTRMPPGLQTSIDVPAHLVPAGTLSVSAQGTGVMTARVDQLPDGGVRITVTADGRAGNIVALHNVLLEGHSSPDRDRELRHETDADVMQVKKEEDYTSP